MIAIRDLRVDYDNLCAVKDLNLTVDDGEVCGLIGPNGAGKTTTMRTMLGLIEPTYGQVEIMGIDVHEQPHEVARMVGFMPDFPPVYEDLFVWEFLDLFAASYRIPPSNRPERIDRHLAMVGLEEKRDAPIIELSRGMRQRLMLAKTLIPDPEVLLLDEPAAGVSPTETAETVALIQRLRATVTIVIVEHDMDVVFGLADRIMVMQNGATIAYGAPEEIRADARVREAYLGGTDDA